ncbi:MAG: tripartite tricarboxylate transporter substrate binding protein [Sphaerochaetaceae bacterium]|nr:tripartite tricarboxylate transporter substrate binding protein [Sphaerochaetaceae bacterium]
MKIRKTVMLISLLMLITSLVTSCTKDDSTKINNANLDSNTTKESTLDYPKSTLKIIVPYAGGGAADIKCRIIAKYLKDELNTDVIVENVIGAGGVIGMTNYLNEEPNTDTIIYTNSSLLAFTPKAQKVAYTKDDFTPIISCDSIIFGMYTAPKNNNILSMEDLVEYAKTNKILFGSPGKGKPIYETQKQLFTALGSDFDTITYENGAKGILNLLGDSTDVLVTSTSAAKDYIKSGDLVNIAMMSDKDFVDPLGNEIKSIYDYGYKLNNDMLGIFAIRKGTDQEIVNYLNKSIKNVLENEEYRNEITEIQDIIWDIRDSESIQNFLNEYENNLGNITSVK